MQTWKKVLLIVTISAVVVGGGIFAYLRFFAGGATAAAKRNRRIKFKKGEKLSGFTSTAFSAGNDSIVDVPSLAASFYSSDTQRSQVKMSLATIGLTYGTYINNIAALTNIKPEILKSFIFVESAGKVDADSKYSKQCCFGLMQISLDTAHDYLRMEYSKGRLTAAEKKIIEKYVPNINYSNPVFTKEDLMKPELNIMLGAIILGILIDEETEERVTKTDIVGNKASSTNPFDLSPNVVEKKEKYIRLDHVINRYNGYYTYYIFNSDGTVKDKNGKKPKGDATAVCAASPSMCSYIKKILGTNGALDILIT